jgi:RNA methyltransferase, TrmH family
MIVSPKNSVVKDIRRLVRSKGDRAVLEGPNLVREALAAGFACEQVLATPEFASSPTGEALLAQIPWRAVDATVVARICDADSPRGVLAIVRLPRGGVELLPSSPGGVYVYAEGLQDPGNLGALARVAEAAGVRGLALSPGSAHPNHPRALRASAGSLLRLPVAIGARADDLAVHLAAVAPTWVALAPRAGVSVYSARLPGAIVLALGSEGAGLSADLAARAQVSLTVPLVPPVESLNATVAAAVVLFELRRRQLSAGGSSGH